MAPPSDNPHIPDLRFSTFWSPGGSLCAFSGICSRGQVFTGNMGVRYLPLGSPTRSQNWLSPPYVYGRLVCGGWVWAGQGCTGGVWVGGYNGWVIPGPVMSCPARSPTAVSPCVGPPYGVLRRVLGTTLGSSPGPLPGPYPGHLPGPCPGHLKTPTQGLKGEIQLSIS